MSLRSLLRDELWITFPEAASLLSCIVRSAAYHLVALVVCQCAGDVAPTLVPILHVLPALHTFFLEFPDARDATCNIFDALTIENSFSWDSSSTVHNYDNICPALSCIAVGDLTASRITAFLDMIQPRILFPAHPTPTASNTSLIQKLTFVRGYLSLYKYVWPEDVISRVERMYEEGLDIRLDSGFRPVYEAGYMSMDGRKSAGGFHSHNGLATGSDSGDLLVVIAACGDSHTFEDFQRAMVYLENKSHNERLRFLPVLYSNLDPGSISSSTQMDAMLVNFQESIKCAESLEQVFRMPIPNDAELGLWPRVCAWISFIQTYWDTLEGVKVLTFNITFLGHYLHLRDYPPIRRSWNRCSASKLSSSGLGKNLQAEDPFLTQGVLKEVCCVLLDAQFTQPSPSG
ncbi:hypothetical protein C8F04DRAFT_1277985 [Mycena alexandri]|uniref:Uncharacterized protein n=1 Tax=Mycena alexandri TaxID=1745969 RepID=A0AAD6WRE0_9AGAR|nr:hypothetical protein C8F04DRAFT_1277985 [Mycena alexandri]